MVKKLSICFISILSILSSVAVYGQGDDLCMPDCPQIEWSAKKIMKVSMAPEYPNCDVDVEYVERASCSGGTKRDFQLTGTYSFLSGPSCDAIKNALAGDGQAAVDMLRLINYRAMLALVKAK